MNYFHHLYKSPTNNFPLPWKTQPKLPCCRILVLISNTPNVYVCCWSLNSHTYNVSLIIIIKLHKHNDTYVHTYIHIRFVNPNNLSYNSWIWNKFQKYNMQHNTQHKNRTNTQHRNSTNTIPKITNPKYKQENMKILQVINISYTRHFLHTWEG